VSLHGSSEADIRHQPVNENSEEKNPGAINILLPYSLKRTIKNIGQLEIIEKMVVY